jgi:acetyl esterase/lipase
MSFPGPVANAAGPNCWFAQGLPPTAEKICDMKRFPSALIPIVALLAAGPAIAAEPFVLDLWPGKPPGDLPVRGEEKSYVRTSLKYATATITTNVTKPTITIYRPPDDKNTGTAMVVMPGGGYWDLYMDIEGKQVAEWLTSQGMTGIVLKYRVPRPPNVPEKLTPIGPQMDAQRAVSLVRSRAAEWGINPKRIGVVGFSAGGHLALMTATTFGKRAYEPIDSVDQVSSRPDFAVMCYSGYLKADDKDEISPSIHIPADTPPIMLVHSTDDSTSPVEHSVIMYLALKRAGIPVELLVFASGEHDFGVRQDGKLPSSWPQLCVKWLRSFDLLQDHP